MIHGTGTGSIIGSANFLVSYGESLDIASRGIKASGAADKGKVVVLPRSRQGRAEPRRGKGRSMLPEKWKPPPPGWVKLNTDAGFGPNSGMAGT
jgi:hypothetical protein